jgi:DNA-binding NarL/FixJ family response regulator
LAGQQIDVVLVDPKRRDGRGLELIQRIAELGKGALLVVLTSYATGLERWTSQKAGASQYLLKDINTEALVDRIRVELSKQPA